MNISTNAEQMGFRIKVEKTEDGYTASSGDLKVSDADSATAVRNLTKSLYEAQLTGGTGKTRRLA